MKVRIFSDVNNYEDFYFNSPYLQETLNFIKLQKGFEYTDRIVQNRYLYVLYKEGEESIILNEDIIFSKLPEEYSVYIIPEIEGEIPVPFILIAALAASTGLTLATSALILAIVGTVMIVAAITIGVMAFLAPTASFQKDPSKSQNNKSSLFNNSPVIREQGGSIPLIYGNPFCSGVLISSGLSTHDIEITPVLTF